MKKQTSNNRSIISKITARVMLLVMLLLLLLATSCSMFATVPTGINIGYGNNIGMGSSPIGFWVACKSDTNEFDINNVILTFSWGFTYPDSYSYPVYEIWFVNDEYQEVFIKQVEEDLNSEEYFITIDTDSETGLFQMNYNHSEDIKIPMELFTKEKGNISFYICVPDDVYNGDGVIPTYVTLNYVTLNYKKCNDKIILSQPKSEIAQILYSIVYY